MRRRTLILFAILFSVFCPASAQDKEPNYVKLTKAQVMANGGSEGTKTLTSEVGIAAKVGPVLGGMSGFCDYRQGVPAQPLFCNFRTWVGPSRVSWFAIASEQGYTAKGPFVFVGANLGPLNIPVVKKSAGKVLRNLSVAPLWRMEGPVAARQLLIVGRTRDFAFNSWCEAYMEALYRMRTGRDYNWWDLRFRHPKHRWISAGIHYEPLYAHQIGVGIRLIGK